MTVEPGTPLGPYEVVALLGAGGMGEVYRARDPRLGREVALKVLPAGLSQDDERIRRFEQEARAAGALNHPNILAVYDVGSEGGTHYVVSELLEGETLRERMGGALASRKAIEIAIQITRGLAAAHEKGIVHRDLKPENIFLVRDGQVKILDFGLAKLLSTPMGFGKGSEAPTAAPATDPGTVLGTVGYMSPEQVRGRPVDHRADIFALGAILYEMLSGQRAFRGETAVETLNAILKEEPPELGETARNLPPALERIVRHCLEKNPEERFHSARDLAFDLAALSEMGSAASMTPLVGGFRHRRLLIALGVALLASHAAVFFLGRQGTSPSAPTYRPLTFRRGMVQGARFTADGQGVVYGAAWGGSSREIYAARLDAPESSSLGLEGARLVATAPGEMALILKEGTLARVPLAGGAPREILRDVQAADWAPGGSDFAVVRVAAGRAQLEFPLGTTLYETTSAIAEIRISPSADRIALVEHPNPGITDALVAVLDRDGKRKVLTDVWGNMGGLAWSPDESEVWFSAARSGISRALHAVSLSGNVRLLARGPGSIVVHDVFRDGRVLVTHEKPQVETAGRAPGETAERDLSWLDRTFIEDLSPDGRMLLFHEGGEAGYFGNPEAGLAFLRPMDGSSAVRLGRGLPFALSQDGKWVALSPDQANTRLALVPTGAGETRPLPAGKIHQYFDAWFIPGEERLLIAGHEDGRPRRLWAQDLSGGEPEPITPEGVATRDNTLTPDGRYVAAAPLEAGSRFELYPLAGGETKAIPALRDREHPLRWSEDGRFLFVREFPFDLPARVARIDVRTGERRDWLELAPADRAGVAGITYVHLSADGGAYAYAYFRLMSDLYLVEAFH